MKFNEYLKETFGINEPIYIDDIRFGDYSRTWIFTEVKRLVESGELKRFDRGIYYFPKVTEWGESSLDPNKIIIPRFITDGNEVYGYISGLSLWNKSGLSTQVPNLLEIATNNETTRVRDIYVGFKRVRARRSRTKITKENARTLQLLDLMNVMQSPTEMDEVERFMLSKFVKKAKEAGVSKESVSEYAGAFPAKAIKNMVESGVIYELA
jgi:hypothetical protein